MALFLQLSTGNPFVLSALIEFIKCNEGSDREKAAFIETLFYLLLGTGALGAQVHSSFIEKNASQQKVSQKESLYIRVSGRC